MLTAILIVVSIILALFILRFILYPSFVAILGEDDNMYDTKKQQKEIVELKQRVANLEFYERFYCDCARERINNFKKED